MKIKRKRARLTHEKSIARFTCSVTPISCVLQMHIIHIENFNNTLLIIICIDFWSLIDKRDAIYIQNLTKFVMLEAVRQFYQPQPQFY